MAGATVAGFLPTAHAEPQAAPLNIVARDAFALWYNRPSVLSSPAGFLLSSVSSRGEAKLHMLGSGGATRVLQNYASISDHGTPVMCLSRDRLVVAMANHSSPLTVATIPLTGLQDSELSLNPIDAGRCTYPTLMPHGDDLLLFYTLGKWNPSDRPSSYRYYVVRRSADGGASWSEAITCIEPVAGEMPYPVAPFATRDGRLWIAFSRLYLASSPEMVTAGLFLSGSEDGGLTWRPVNSGKPVFSGPQGVMFQVYDACGVGDGIRTLSLCADGRWGDEWTEVNAFVVDLHTSFGIQAASELKIPNISWTSYPNGGIISRSNPDRVLLAQRLGDASALGEWELKGSRALPVRMISAEGGLVFPFQTEEGNLFAHTNYRSVSTPVFYSDIARL